MAEKDAELQRCHKRLRELEAMARVPRHPEPSTGSCLLDVVLHTVAVPQGPCPAWARVPTFAKAFDDPECARTLVAVRGTCRVARAFRNASGEMDAYLNDCKFRKVAGCFRKFLDRGSAALLLDVLPDETPETLEMEYPGITRRILFNRDPMSSDSSEDETEDLRRTLSSSESDTSGGLRDP